MVIDEALKIAREKLNSSNIDSREARLLLAYSMGINSSELIKYTTCTDEQFEEYMKIVSRRINGEPFAYIVGYKEFMKLNFKVNSSVLIPRDDTEILVDRAINSGKEKILDMCTGSGCIAISLAKYIEGANVCAVDVSKEALEIAKINAKNNQVDVRFIESNLFENVDDKFDLIVSNPPYIRKEVIDTLQTEVKNEPHLALDGGDDGLDFYRRIANDAYEYLNEKGLLMFEIGYDQADDVMNILKERYVDIEVTKDLSGNDRVVSCKRG